MIIVDNRVSQSHPEIEKNTILKIINGVDTKYYLVTRMLESDTRDSFKDGQWCYINLDNHSACVCFRKFPTSMALLGYLYEKNDKIEIIKPSEYHIVISG